MINLNKLGLSIIHCLIMLSITNISFATNAGHITSDNHSDQLEIVAESVFFNQKSTPKLMTACQSGDAYLYILPDRPPKSATFKNPTSRAIFNVSLTLGPSFHHVSYSSCPGNQIPAYGTCVINFSTTVSAPMVQERVSITGQAAGNGPTVTGYLCLETRP